MDLVNQSGSPKFEEAGRKHLSLKSLYLSLAILSAVATWGLFLQFLFSGDASIDAFFQQSFATAISDLWASDVLISTLVFFIFARLELKRLGVPASRLAIYFVATFSVGLCFAFSLFLYQRENWKVRAQLAQS
ncbi:MAG: DUF2834 domain-containing protein [Phormidesmis sp.]